MDTATIIMILVGAAVGGGAGYFYRKMQAQKETATAEAKATKLIEEAKTKARELILEAKDESLKVSESAKKEEKERRSQLLAREQQLATREESLDKRFDTLEKKESDFKKDALEIEKIKEELRSIRTKQEENLSKIAKLSKEKAKEKLLEITEKEIKDDLVTHIKKVESETNEDADKLAREILTTVIQRMASEITAETTVSSVDLPNDEMKGRIIGREGRNIQAIERATGCDIIIDDTPETLIISGFDPVRRAVAKFTIEKLIADGRIHPTRIEEMAKKAEEEVDKMVKESGEQAAYEVGVAGLPADLIKILGRLRFRTSYAQNVLKHSVETARIAAALAGELKADVNICKKAGLLHDIGKTIDQEIGGSHAAISRDIAKKYGMPDEMVHAIEAHHEEVEFKTPEAIIVQVADAISGSRPGARRDTLESYIKRLGELEKIASSFPGVEKSFAIQAGREVRVIVYPEEIDDLEAIKLAKNVAGKIEKDLKYPGQIKVTVIRETRAIEYAK